jgi:hypothetical protein
MQITQAFTCYQDPVRMCSVRANRERTAMHLEGAE